MISGSRTDFVKNGAEHFFLYNFCHEDGELSSDEKL